MPRYGLRDGRSSGAGALEQAQRYTTTLDGRQLVLETPELRLTFAAAE